MAKFRVSGYAIINGYKTIDEARMAAIKKYIELRYLKIKLVIDKRCKA